MVGLIDQQLTAFDCNGIPIYYLDDMITAINRNSYQDLLKILILRYVSILVNMDNMEPSLNMNVY